jgi:hypothetical protein
VKLAADLPIQLSHAPAATKRFGFVKRSFFN